MEDRRHGYIPAFGDWDYSDDLPITQYFESAMQAGLLRGHFHGEAPAYDDLFKSSHSIKQHQEEQAQIIKKIGDPKQQQQQQRGQERSQGKKVYDAGRAQTRPRRAPMAVDEDLYKIPPELLQEKPRRKRMLKSLWTSCLRLNCSA
ncbi:uncharacterized protein LOC122001075 isoform X2 [Zingiber officinale]|uniref:uncharacterized protein LOC122001075 isoform X2 n=1 Tax=Zingiber officinale TaxID=94328 RepID=UPI001C4B9C93|nr:uncharacterized protein LOC122001075 isoform X2 [Zingiber officinale]